MTSIQALANEFGVTLLDDNKTHTNRMEIMSANSDKVYIVSQAKSGKNEGQWQCSCKGWIFHRTCKHLDAMMPALCTLEAPKSKPLALVSDRDPFMVKKTSEKKTKAPAKAPATKKPAAAAARKAPAKKKAEPAEVKVVAAVHVPGIGLLEVTDPRAMAYMAHKKVSYSV